MKKKGVNSQNINDCDRLTVKINRYLNQRDLDHKCIVRVTKQDEWFEFSGKVDSQETCAEIFDFVPRQNGAQWIVNKMSIQ